MRGVAAAAAADDDDDNNGGGSGSDDNDDDDDDDDYRRGVVCVGSANEKEALWAHPRSALRAHGGGSGGGGGGLALESDLEAGWERTTDARRPIPWPLMSMPSGLKCGKCS